MIDELIKRSRSFRRFDPTVKVDRQTLTALVDLARHSPSARNLQPLRFILVCDPPRVAEVFSTLKWATLLRHWGGPTEGERPPAYIIIVGDMRLTDNFAYDAGIAAQSMRLGAADRGLGGCILASIDRRKIREIFDIPACYEVLLVLAIGKPAETVVLDPLPPDGCTAYWRDSRGVHHVPKRPLEELILDF